MKPLVIVSCGRKKLDQAAPASQLYTGGLFVASLAYARSLTPDDHIRVLSAKHGLVKLDQLLDPYDVRMGQEGAISATQILDQIERMDLAELPVYYRIIKILAGQDYWQVLESCFKSYIKTSTARYLQRPLAGLGIGQQIKWLKDNTPKIKIVDSDSKLRESRPWTDFNEAEPPAGTVVEILLNDGTTVNGEAFWDDSEALYYVPEIPDLFATHWRFLEEKKRDAT